jgi:predicted nucleic acid-binding Zn finger protein
MLPAVDPAGVTAASALVEGLLRGVANARQLDDGVLLSLSAVVGKPLAAALELLDGGAVERVVARRSRRRFYRVAGRAHGGRAAPEPYVCLADFCTCKSYYFDVLRRGGLRFHFRSRGPAQSDVDVAVADTTGELRKLAQLADIVFVGKSLPPHTEGQTPVEAAALEKPILFGPGMSNFHWISRELLARGAARQGEAPPCRGRCRRRGRRSSPSAKAR